MRTFCGSTCKMAASEKTNEEYEWEFAEPPPIEFDCPICHNVLGEPNLTSCCGSHFCQVCIEPIVREGRPCPNPECNKCGFTAFLDKSVRRKIFGLDVRCPMWRRGCNWNGELAKRDGHLDVKNGDCQFVDVDCSKGCGGRVQRRELFEHLQQYCPKRRYTCDYCGFEAIYEVVNSQHWPVCENFPLSCPNECGVEKVERRHFEQHLSECPLQEAECDFSFAGCDVKVRRRDLHQHMEENTQNHIRMLSRHTVMTTKQLHAKLKEKDHQAVELQEKLQREVQQLQEKDEKIHRDLEYQIREVQEQKNRQIADVQEVLQLKDQQLAHITAQLQDKISKLEATLGEKEQENKALRERVKRLETSVFHQHSFSMPNFSRYKAILSKYWYSPDFYVMKYKIHVSIAVVASSNAEASGKVTSVEVHLKHGEFDNELTWPLKATITLQLIDPSMSHRPYERSLKREWVRVPRGCIKDDKCCWRPFITHTELGKYLQDDTLHFRVDLYTD